MWWPTHARSPLREAERALQLGAAGEQRAAAARPAAGGAGHVAARAPQHSGLRRDRRARPSRRCACGSGGRAAGTGRRCRPAARARPRRGRRSARRRRCRSSSPAARRRRPAAGGAAASRGASRRGPADRGATAAAHRARPAGAARGRSAARGAASSAVLGVVELDERRAASSVAHHQRERLVLAVLARAQPRDRRLVVGAAGEVEAADALDRDDRRRSSAAAAVAAARDRRVGGRVGRRSAAAARSRGRRWAARGSGGRAGPRTRPGSAAHIAKPAIVVSGRS